VSRTVSPSAGRPYGLARTCRTLELPRSTVYAARARRRRPGLPRQRGPKTAWTDAALTERIRQVLADSPFVGEGYRKVWARLRTAGVEPVRTSKGRVLRLMRAAGLLAPTRVGTPRGPKAHDGTIIPAAPDIMWGTDATGCLTGEGHATIFFAVDHFTAECVGIHAARRGTRFEALEPLRQGVRACFGAYAEAAATGLSLRHDHGSQFLSDLYQGELRFLGIASSPAFVREPEGNGCAERFVRTLKEQLLWLQPFVTVEALRLALLAFKDRYNSGWLIERHGHRSPASVRATFSPGGAPPPVPGLAA
jgi:transposase InsO family protein